MKQFIGESDISTLIFVGMVDGKVDAIPVHFGGYGGYMAEIIGSEEVVLSNYEPVAVFDTWLTIYDDNGIGWKAYDFGSAFTVYRAGGYGCIIQVTK